MRIKDVIGRSIFSSHYPGCDRWKRWTVTGTFDMRLLRICRSTRSSQRQAANSWAQVFSRRCTTENDEQTWTAAMKFTAGNICDIDNQESRARSTTSRIVGSLKLWTSLNIFERYLSKAACRRLHQLLQRCLPVDFNRNVLVSCQGGWGRRMYWYTDWQIGGWLSIQWIPLEAFSSRVPRMQWMTTPHIVCVDPSTNVFDTIYNL